MDYRKIQINGECTYTVSLPKKWIQRNQLKKGDLVCVTDKGREVVFQSSQRKKSRVQIFMAKEDLDLLYKNLVTKYIQGFDIIEIKSEKSLSAKVRKNLTNLSMQLIGLEPFRQTQNTITYEMMVNGEGEIEESIKRMYEMSILSLNQMLNQENFAKAIKERDKEIDRFYYLSLRQISHTNGFQAGLWAQIARDIKRISEHLKQISELIDRLNEDQNEQLGHIEKIFKDTMQSLNEKDQQKAYACISELNTMEFKEEDLLLYSYLARIRDRIRDMADSTVNLS